jgi:hypothetical protein
MFKIIKFFQNIVMLNNRLTVEVEQQKEEGYSIEHDFHGYDYYLNYREGDKEATAQLKFLSDFTREVKLFRNSYPKWTKPKGEEITPFDHQKLTNRFAKYLACWSGEVLLDDTPFEYEDLEQIKERLTKARIKFEERDGYVFYTVDIEDARKREDSPLNRYK